ncbi:MAG: rRNA maturation RNase YbeY [Tannerellaceae bacterium]|jgi:rRNA maturation RNase YbeY|nr:rRNA maturation RNase YbeY [Tannerellaceae bacterium]
MNISFLAEDIELPQIKKQIVAGWIRTVATNHDKKIGEITYIFCSENKILEINNQYLGHDYYTDIITFDYTKEDIISGDIFISPNTVKSNAEELSTSYNEELHRVIIHGILHLCGINDKEDRAGMENHENIALTILPKEAYKTT